MAEPQIFISHSSEDNRWCSEFASLLQDAGCDVWYDTRSLEPGTSWVQSIQNELQKREFFVVVITPASYASRWVQEEIQLAFIANRTIVPIILQQTPEAHGFILNRQWISAIDRTVADMATKVATLVGATLLDSPSKALSNDGWEKTQKRINAHETESTQFPSLPPQPLYGSTVLQPPTPFGSQQPYPQNWAPQAAYPSPAYGAQASQSPFPENYPPAFLASMPPQSPYGFPTPMYPHRLPGGPASHILPPRLTQLKFQGRTLGSITTNGDSVEVIISPFCYITESEFLMGSVTSRDHESYERELPQHTIFLGSFEIGKYPVTVAEYDCAVRAGIVYMPPTIAGLTWEQQCEHVEYPVVGITWEDATAYCKWLTSITTQVYRLPTEAEWEKAARGTKGRIYPWGNTKTGFFNRAHANTSERNTGSATAIGAYPSGASPYGVMDMAGNVWEWCHSLYAAYPYDKNDGREGETSDRSRVVRGGSWQQALRAARTANRNSSAPTSRSGTIGFRLARDS